VGHHITALVLATPWHEAVRARFDLVAVPLRGVTMFHIDHYYSAYWRAKLGWPGTLERPPGCSSLFPDDAVLAHIASELVGDPTPTFGVIQTDYFSGAGEQWAALYKRTHRTSGDETSINAVLRLLGIEAAPGLDEFDTVGLADHRSPPEELERYVELCDQLGV
jgi:hypothetical protein